jgi:hypothetical protein
MLNEEDNLAEAEKKALYSLKKELDGHNYLSEGVFNLTGKVLNQIPEMDLSKVPQSLKVAVSLLTRISNDLRCVAMLANHGYSVQAVSLAASIYEAAFTIAYIGNDEKLAQEWIEHDKPTKSFRGVKTITMEGFKKLGIPNVDQQTKTKYRVYQQLCMPKHNNPLFQMQQGIILSKDFMFSMNGPDTSETSVRNAWFALEHGSALARLAIVSFIENHVPKSQRHLLEQELMILGDKRKELASRAKQRWETQDPFPGKW